MAKSVELLQRKGSESYLFDVRFGALVSGSCNRCGYFASSLWQIEKGKRLLSDI